MFSELAMESLYSNIKSSHFKLSSVASSKSVAPLAPIGIGWQCQLAQLVVKIKIKI